MNNVLTFKSFLFAGSIFGLWDTFTLENFFHHWYPATDFQSPSHSEKPKTQTSDNKHSGCDFIPKWALVKKKKKENFKSKLLFPSFPQAKKDSWVVSSPSRPLLWRYCSIFHSPHSSQQQLPALPVNNQWLGGAPPPVLSTHYFPMNTAE